MIPYGRQQIDDADCAAVLEALRSDFLTQGPHTERFELAMAAKVGAQHGVAVNSATSALHLACLALGVGPGDQVWTSPNSFVASANCARYCGACVDFVDIDRATLNLCPQALAAKLEQAERCGRLPKVVIPVHFGGEPCAMAPIAALAERYGFAVIEDASHAVGAHYHGEPVGNCRYSAITVFSFHPVKIITTAEGGLATTNDPQLAARMALLRSHGITRDSRQLSRIDEGPWYYEQQQLGFNYRLTDLQAALGLSQLSKLDAFIARRQQLRQAYQRQLAALPLQLQQQDAANLSANHLLVIRLADDAALNRRQLFDELRSAGIGVNVHYIPIYWQPDFAALGFAAGLCPHAEWYYQGALSLPLYPGLQDEQLTHICQQLALLLTGDSGQR